MPAPEPAGTERDADYYRADYGRYAPDWIPEPDNMSQATWNRYLASKPGSRKHKKAYANMHQEANGRGFPRPDPEQSYLADHGYDSGPGPRPGSRRTRRRHPRRPGAPGPGSPVRRPRMRRGRPGDRARRRALRRSGGPRALAAPPLPGCGRRAHPRAHDRDPARRHPACQPVPGRAWLAGPRRRVRRSAAGPGRGGLSPVLRREASHRRPSRRSTGRSGRDGHHPAGRRSDTPTRECENGSDGHSRQLGGSSAGDRGASRSITWQRQR